MLLNKNMNSLKKITAVFSSFYKKKIFTIFDNNNERDLYKSLNFIQCFNKNDNTNHANRYSVNLESNFNEKNITFPKNNLNYSFKYNKHQKNLNYVNKYSVNTINNNEKKEILGCDATNDRDYTDFLEKNKPTPGTRQNEEESSNVLIIYTGGTMGMIKSEEGSLVPRKGYLTEQIKQLSELQHPPTPEVDIIEFDPIMDSSDMTYKEWGEIVALVEKYYFDYDGFVVIMGTDTMSYASSAVSFMLQNLTKPVIFTGSMIPFYVPYNDAKRNLIVSLLIAGTIDIPEVCIFFNNELLRANRSIKTDSRDLGAFISPNYPALAHLGTGLVMHKKFITEYPKGKFKAYKKIDSRITVIKLIPGFDDEFFSQALSNLSNNNCRGIVMELYGTGNLPSKKRSLIECLKRASDRGIVVCATTQCQRGGLKFGEYGVSRELLASNVIGCGDMTTASVVTKLAYLFGRQVGLEKIREVMVEDIRGEISKEYINVLQSTKKGKSIY
eukprot:TRINITY_DN8544_c0_g1_i1.p1 TRINITY_DN8544_c0_g1~~TRINITY_DN8544_c0_g1_i1.p1  ORF type:complete len:498 (+),score=115.32 TRINITY_DN8544_c0_g1_i1:44-1537(+)